MQQQQQQRQQQCSVPKSQTWHHLRQPALLSDLHHRDSDHCPMHKSLKVSADMAPPGGAPSRHRTGSASSQSQDSRVCHPERPVSPHRALADSRLAKSRKNRTAAADKYQHPEQNLYHAEPQLNQVPNNQDTRHQQDARPKIMLANHNLIGHVLDTSVEEVPTDYPDSSIYQGEDYTTQLQQYYRDRRSPDHAKAQSETPQPQSNQRKSRVFKKYRELHCGSFPTSDISIEYHGKLPGKNSKMSQSRDSGVNCVGLQQPQHHNGVTPLNNSAHLTTHHSPGATTCEHACNGQISHQVQVHRIPEDVHEDGGFQSPRAPADTISNMEILNNGCMASTESLTLGGSDLYPAKGSVNLQNSSHPSYGSSSWSSSLQTVREVPLPPPREQSAELPPGEKNHKHRSASLPPGVEISGLRQSGVRQEPYTEVHLVPEPRKHSHGKQKDRLRDKSPRRQSGGYRDWQHQQPRHSDISPPHVKAGHVGSRRSSRGDNHSTDYEVVGVV